MHPSLRPANIFRAQKEFFDLNTACAKNFWNSTSGEHSSRARVLTWVRALFLRMLARMLHGIK